MKTGMTVNEVSKLTGLSVRTLQYYDRIGLLTPSGHTGAGYRLYDDTALESLQQIMLFRELEFPLKDIKAIMSDPHFDREKALGQQIELLKLRREHLDGLIEFAEKIKNTGGINMEFNAFDTSKLDEYAKRAKEQWGNTAEYRESEKKSSKEFLLLLSIKASYQSQALLRYIRSIYHDNKWIKQAFIQKKYLDALSLYYLLFV